MKVIQPPSPTIPRFTVIDKENLLVFTFSSRIKSWLSPIRLLIWSLLIVFSLLYFMILSPLQNLVPTNEFLGFTSFALIPWAFLLVGLPLAGWLHSYQESVKITSKGIVIKRFPILGSAKSNQYLSDHIRDFKIIQTNNYYMDFMPATGIYRYGPISFQYGGKRFLMGMGIPQEEAEEVLALIAKKFPQYTNNKSTSESLN